MSFGAKEVKELREIAKDLPYDFWVTLVGDTITEEALPTYETWLMDVEGVTQKGENGDNGGRSETGNQDLSPPREGRPKAQLETPAM